MSKTNIAAVIFDCDGVLVDSEMISVGVLQAMTSEMGWSLSDQMFREVFLGRSFASGTARAETAFGAKFPDDFELRYRDRLFVELSKKLKPMAGITSLLSSLRVPYCVATGSSPKRLALSLDVTGLSHFFSNNRYTASEVAQSKPAPDLCFYAADKMNVTPHDCLVIEDSEMGVLAGQAADMEVWHFAGGAHIKVGYHLPENLAVAKSFSDMSNLQLALTEIGVCGK